MNSVAVHSSESEVGRSARPRGPCSRLGRGRSSKVRLMTKISFQQQWNNTRCVSARMTAARRTHVASQDSHAHDSHVASMSRTPATHIYFTDTPSHEAAARPNPDIMRTRATTHTGTCSIDCTRRSPTTSRAPLPNRPPPSLATGTPHRGLDLCRRPWGALLRVGAASHCRGRGARTQTGATRAWARPC